MIYDELRSHAATLLRLSYACKEEKMAEEIRKVAYALFALADGRCARPTPSE